MAKVKKTKTLRKYKKKAPKLNHQLSRVLRSRNYSPLTDILDQLPFLEPADRIKVGFKILEYLYAKPRAIDTQITKKKAPSNQVNVQVNVPKEEKEPATPEDLVKLMAVAKGDDTN